MSPPATPTVHEYLICQINEPLASGRSVTDAIDAYEGNDGSLQAIFCHQNGTMWLVDFWISDDNLEIMVRGERLTGRDENTPENEGLEYLRYEIQHVCRPGSSDCDCEGQLVQHEVYVGEKLELEIDTQEYRANLRTPWGRLL
jgi:hypothetical protein